MPQRRITTPNQDTTMKPTIETWLDVSPIPASGGWPTLSSASLTGGNLVISSASPGEQQATHVPGVLPGHHYRVMITSTGATENFLVTLGGTTIGTLSSGNPTLDVVVKPQSANFKGPSTLEVQNNGAGLGNITITSIRIVAYDPIRLANLPDIYNP